jgi:hypothetical protein
LWNGYDHGGGGLSALTLIVAGQSSVSAPAQIVPIVSNAIAATAHAIPAGLIQNPLYENSQRRNYRLDRRPAQAGTIGKWPILANRSGGCREGAQSVIENP